MVRDRAVPAETILAMSTDHTGLARPSRGVSGLATNVAEIDRPGHYSVFLPRAASD